MTSVLWGSVAMDQVTFRLIFCGFLLICVSSGPITKDVEIYSFHLKSTVNSRYAITAITSRVANRLTHPQEVHFEVKIPKNAFISSFRMTIDGQTYDGVVKKKEDAEQQYSEAASRGESAGLVSSVGRSLEDFKTSVTVAALGKVTFELTYEQLLVRRLGKYELLINAQPMQLVADFMIDVDIHESSGISFLEVTGGLTTGELANAITRKQAGKKAWISFYPTRQQQKKCVSCGADGLNGDLIITYDVERSKQPGEIKASNGFFAHYFAPKGIPPIPKNVMFVIDISGSMKGQKIDQTRLAMVKILEDLAGDDYFGLITFNSEIKVWKPELLQATKENLETAKAFVNNIKANGNTDINSAVMKGVEMIKNDPQKYSAPILILLTDGDPNTGESNFERIQDNVKKAIGGKIPLYCLGFGFDVKFEFLEKMALENNGVARRIYEGSDAGEQLQGFYNEVATPLLTNIQLKYIGALFLTQTSFSQYYNGSEIVVAGKITNNNLKSFQTEVIAASKGSQVRYHEPVSIEDFTGVLPEHEFFIERLWAYLTVKQLLEKELTLKGQEKESVSQKVVDLSLMYKFVTPLTSMVITKPQEKTQVVHKPKEDKKHLRVEVVHTPPSSSPQFDISFPHSPTKIKKPHRVQMAHTPSSSSPEFDISSKRSSGLKGHLGRHSHSQGSQYLVLSENSKTARASPSRPVRKVTFLLSVEGESHPLCYQVQTPDNLRLLQDASSDFSMNGKLAPNGFEHILLRYQRQHGLNLSTSEITYTDGLKHMKWEWGPEYTVHETDSVSLILRDNEVDITMGNIRLIILLHKKDGKSFLWPVVRQQPKDVSVQGILGKRDVQYQKLSDSRIKINNSEVKAVWHSAPDYSLHNALELECWLVPFETVMQEKLSKFTLTDL